MTKLSFRLSRAIAGGRLRQGAPSSRATVLARLLRKRAAARVAGQQELEAKIRNQILWALPIETPTDEQVETPADGED